MRRAVWGLVVASLAACHEKEVAVVVVPVVEVDAGVDAGPPKPPEPESVQTLPLDEEPLLSVDDEAQFRALLLRDPDAAERQLVSLETPTEWQVAILAQFALRHGDHSLKARREPSLPVIANTHPALDGGAAWVYNDGTALRATPPGRRKTPQVIAVLGAGTKVDVLAVDGGTAWVGVELARVVEFAEASNRVIERGLEQPSHVDFQHFEGELPLGALTGEQPSAEATAELAKREPDPDRAAALWLRALQLEPTEAARAGLLDAAWAARRPSLVAAAAHERAFAPARQLELAWGCSGPPGSSTFIRWPVKRPPKEPVCVTDLDLHEGCPSDSARDLAVREQLAKARETLGLSPRPMLRAVTDGRAQRGLLLANFEVETVDACADFRELKVSGWSATLRRLALPPGVPNLVVLVPAERPIGREYAFVSAASEAKAIAWIRSRSHVQWTVGPHGQLHASLHDGDNGFHLERDVQVTAWATAPERDCSCQ